MVAGILGIWLLFFFTYVGLVFGWVWEFLCIGYIARLSMYVCMYVCIFGGVSKFSSYITRVSNYFWIMQC
jgi:hypothetical protein